VFAAAEATGTALEVNGGLPRLDLSVEALRRARGRNVTFLLDSDAHEVGELDRVNYAMLNAERAWLDRERVANAWDAERLIAWLARKVPGATRRAELPAACARVSTRSQTALRAGAASAPRRRRPLSRRRRRRRGRRSSRRRSRRAKDEVPPLARAGAADRVVRQCAAPRRRIERMRGELPENVTASPAWIARHFGS
jgi:hypothetical protein